MKKPHILLGIAIFLVFVVIFSIVKLSEKKYNFQGPDKSIEKASLNQLTATGAAKKESR